MILDKHWWWTADRKRVVPDGHPDASFLAFARGHELGDAVARTYGILREAVDQDEAAAESGGELPQEKAKAAPANKARPKPGDKAGENHDQ